MTAGNPLPTTHRGWRALLEQLGVRPSKGMGQNFLVEVGVAERIAKTAKIQPGEVVVEVGPGLGMLTNQLLRQADRVIGVELDDQLAHHLERTFPEGRLTVLHEDGVRVDLAGVIPAGQPWLMAANLPYSVAAAVLRHFQEMEHGPDRIIVMVQREVAERIVASPPDMSILAVGVQFYGSPRIAFKVSPTVFIPEPRVESAVLVIERRRDLPLPHQQHPDFFRLVNAGFRHKRKQLANSIHDELRLPKDEVTGWLERGGIESQRRAETLSVNEWVRLFLAAPAGAFDAPR